MNKIVLATLSILVGALFADLSYWWTVDPFWARVSLWLVGAGLVMGALAAVFGLTDFLTIQRAREPTVGRVHFPGNAAAVMALAAPLRIVALINLLWRLGNPAPAVLPWGLTFPAVTALMLVVTGWLGGELSYRHLIGVTRHGAENPADPSLLPQPASDTEPATAQTGGRIRGH